MIHFGSFSDYFVQKLAIAYSHLISNGFTTVLGFFA